MNNSKQPAFAAVCDNSNPYLQEGLTKREHFASMAMQGIISGATLNLSKEEADIVASQSIQFADSLLAQLEKE